MAQPQTVDGRRRAVIEHLEPQIDGGRFPIKRIVGDRVLVRADVFGDGHDAIAATLLVLEPGAKAWRRQPMRFLNNDGWEAEFTVAAVGEYRYTVEGRVDHFASWHRDLKKRVEARQHVAVDLQIGAELVARAAEHASGDDATALRHWAARLEQEGAAAGLDLNELERLAELMSRNPDLDFAARFEPELRIVVDRQRAEFSAWYELFPRSTSTEANRHGTFNDLIARLPYIAGLGFDVVYLPPIHPIGTKFRKGRNNAVSAEAGEPGSPWAIGGAAGGHTAILPELGTEADFARLVAAAHSQGLEIALDIAFQCSPDHPWVAEHPQWFKHRPDGTIQYAENPPKKYQDIYPFDFESSDWRGLWDALRDVFLYWAERGVRIFRVDNPHTKAFPFWEWCLPDIKQRFPDVLFLAEAFTRPKPMYRLAKLGFSQSYTYFTWRNGKQEFIEYLTELTKPPVAEFFRPNFWPNTPDILPEHLQHGGPAAFAARLVLAATLSSNYGIYGPTFELMEHQAREPGSEEYLNSEKYEVRTWDLDRPNNLRDLITRVNRARRDNRALQSNHNLRFHPASNDQLLCYSKRCENPANLMLVVVNLDFYRLQNGWIDLPLEELGLGPDGHFRVHDLLTDRTFTWQARRNWVELDPQIAAAHLFRIEQ